MTAPTGRSLWLDTAAAREPSPPLRARSHADVAVIGAGITGLSAALLLARSGTRVTLLEARGVASGVTGHTTAKVTSLHGLSYRRLAKRFGRDTARVYGEANEAGLAKVAAWVDELEIDCDFERGSSYTYAASEGDREKVEQEAKLAAELGLPATYADALPELPFPVAGAVRFDDQARFQPVAYLHGLAAAFEAAGGTLHEGTRATGVRDGNVHTEHGATLTADRILVATHLPFLDRGMFFALTHPERSYVIAAESGSRPAMYLSSEQPAHSISAYGELLLVAGESHRPGEGDPRARYAALERWARERFDIGAVRYRWSAHDTMPVDGKPYVGRVWPTSDRVLTATGYKKWGLTMGTAAAMMLSDALLGRDNPWASEYSGWRLANPAAALELAKGNANVGRHFVADRLTRTGPRCTHLGCVTNWNEAEQTWDCPCHGARFAADGSVLHGPATRPLRLVGTMHAE